MANHAYVFHCKESLTYEKVLSLVKRFAEENMKGVFTLEDEGEGRFFLSLDEYNGVEFWISDYVDYSWEELEFDGDKNTCIEIRHGHFGELHSFMWWVDWKLQNFLAYHLKGKIADDGAGILDEDPEDCNEGYSKTIFREDVTRLSKISGWIEWRRIRVKYPELKVLY